MEVAAPDDFSGQDREPDFDLIKPGGVARREVEGDAVSGIAEKGFTGFHGVQDASFSLQPEVLLDTIVFGNQSDDAFGQVGVQVVRDDFPFCTGWLAGDQALEECGVVLLCAPRANPAQNPSRGNIEGGDQGLRTMADVFVFAPLHKTRSHRLRWRGALQRLDAGHFINRDGTNAFLRPFLRFGVNMADISTFLVKQRVRLGRQPIADAMRLQVRLF